MNIVLYIFTGEVKDDTPNLFTNYQYNSFSQPLRGQFLPVLFNTTYDNVRFLKKIKGKIPICGTIDTNTVNEHYFVINILLIILTYFCA